MSLMWEEIHEQPEVLARAGQENAPVLEKLTKELKSRPITGIVIAARGTSDHAAVYGKYVLEMTTGLPVSLAAPSVLTVYGRKLKYENTLVIGISQSGKAGDAAEVLKAAGECGAVTVSVTNYPDSPLAKLSRYHLWCDAGDEKSVAATKTFTSQIYLLGLLAALWSGDSALKAELSSLPGKVGEIFGLADSITETVKRYRFMKECLVLARGINYAVALEAALKIQETSYVRAKAFATSDFHHGPMAMVEKDMPVIVFAPSGPALADVNSLLPTLLSSGADLLVVSDLPELCAQGSCSIRIPAQTSDFTSPFCNAAVAQMFACRLSELKGLDPDRPRLLHKVTVTR